MKRKELMAIVALAAGLSGAVSTTTHAYAGNKSEDKGNDHTQVAASGDLNALGNRFGFGFGFGRDNDEDDDDGVRGNGHGPHFGWTHGHGHFHHGHGHGYGHDHHNHEPY
jgi:hypothetical protein